MQVIQLPFAAKSVLGCGSHARATFCLANKGFAYVSEDFGNLETIENFVNYKKRIGQVKQELGITPSIIAHDLHPDYLSTRFAMEQNENPCRMALEHLLVAAVVIVITPYVGDLKYAKKIVSVMRRHKYGRDARIIGRVVRSPKMVMLRTVTGTRRILDMLSGEQLPRIC